MACFASAEDVMNNAPCYEARCTVHTANARTCDEYVQETFAFLQRGHSMLHPQCECKLAGVSVERCMELGVSRERAKGCCYVERKRGRRSVDEIALELCVADLRGLVMQNGRWISLYDALVTLAGMQETKSDEGKRFLHSALCCIPPVISTMEEMVMAARVMAPFPFVMNKHNSNPGTMHIILGQKDSRIVCLPCSTGGVAAFAKVGDLENVDAPLRDLWFDETVTQSKEERSRMKRAEVLQELLVQAGIAPQPCRTRVQESKRKRALPKGAGNKRLDVLTLF
jgi:hypothetical protein